jgi:hypothetical protein
MPKIAMRAEVLFLAEQFWGRVHEAFPFPRDIERATMLALPVFVVKLPRLTVERIASWLHARGAAIAVPLCEGDMAGCVVAHRGRAVIFVAGSDPADEQRATVAHELAHFIRHYLVPRERAVRTLGVAIVGVLDGDREPTYAERARGVLRDVPVGVHVHILPRGDRQGVIAQVEREADELALELLAPREAAAEYLRSIGAPDLSPRQRRRLLGKHFGLPPNWFAPYAPDQPSRPTDRLGNLLTRLRRGE